ncbi:hypothetical protein LTR49_004899 [Elasticomyces elasticus]|nr:hypothetical protein LTR49_004899 [Elasticomyces elasticus]
MLSLRGRRSFNESISGKALIAMPPDLDDLENPPSPHRFLTGSRRQPSPANSAKGPPGQRKAVHQQPVERPVRLPPPTTGSQFATPPRFSTGRSKQPLRQPSPPRPAFVESLRPQYHAEDISSDTRDGDEEMLDNEQAEALPTTEFQQAVNSHDTVSALPFSPKRRRVDEHVDETFSPSRPAFKQPQTPASHNRGTIPRFAIPSGSIASVIDDSLALHRPQFVRPSVPPQEHTEPLPEAFSPHRRGQKFVPGGMAAMVQQWVIETGQTAVQSRRGQAYLRGEDYVVKLKFDHVEGSGPYLARAKTTEGGVVHIILTAVQDNSAALSAGNVVGLRAPTWDVESKGRMWKVGIDWKVL